MVIQSSKRVLKGGKKKGGKYKYDKDQILFAEIDTLDEDDYEDLNGWVSVEFDDDEMTIDYHIKDGPKRCDTCKLAIYDGYSCDDLDDPYYDTEENPWSYEDTPYITNKKRRAAGFLEVENGYSYKKNMCMFVVLFDEDDDDRRRNLSTTNSSKNDMRVLKGGKKKSKGPKKIGCGQLIPEDEDEDYCE